MGRPLPKTQTVPQSPKSQPVVSRMGIQYGIAPFGHAGWLALSPTDDYNNYSR